MFWQRINLKTKYLSISIYPSSVGVIVSGIVPQKNVQAGLFDVVNRDKETILFKSFDKINRKNGKDKVRVAAQGFDRKWRLRSEKLSKCYTTRWSEMLT